MKNKSENKGKERGISPIPSWGDEDEDEFQIIQKIICDSDTSSTLANRLSNWLQSLKDRVQPKQGWSKEDEQRATWKPTTEQMMYLNKVIDATDIVSEEHDALLELWKDLKKLKD